MTMITVTQQPVQTVVVTALQAQSAQVYKAGRYRLTQSAVGVVDGINAVFAASVPFEPGSIEVYVNGIKERFFRLISDTEIELENPPKTGGYSDYIELVYLQK